MKIKNRSNFLLYAGSTKHVVLPKRHISKPSFFFMWGYFLWRFFDVVQMPVFNFNKSP